MDAFFLLNYMQLVVAVFVAIMGIANTLIISVAERKREFGIIRAIGGYRAQIRKMVLLEALAISVVGVMVACGGRAVQHTIHVAHGVHGAGRIRGAVLFSVAADPGVAARGDCRIAAGWLGSRAPRDAGASDRGDWV